MNEVAALLAAFREATGREAALWVRRDGHTSSKLIATTSEAFGVATEDGPLAWDVPGWARSHELVAHLANTGESVGWLFAEDGGDGECDLLLGRLIPIVSRLVHERDGAAQELVERYEEINLLYAISELLGGTTSVEMVAETLVRELAITVGATRAVFLRTTDNRTALSPIASVGLADVPYPAVALDNSSHIAARAFRSVGACTAENLAARDADPVLSAHGDPLLAVAITRPSTGIGITGSFPAVTAARPLPSAMESHGLVPLGVLVLGGPRGGTPFSAGDRKLASAVGTQIGAAMHNASLVSAAIARQQLERELQLAHDLQLKLLPSTTVVEPEARAAARVIAAERVGGDFFLLARLDRDRTGVLIGDVSGHGYQAALVMALALSAAAIHVQAAFDPSIAIEAVRRSLADELSSTEMSLSLCYAVIDTRVNELRFANAGHPHAFRVGANGQCTRLAAIAPPIGFSDAPLEECVMEWRTGDRLVLFTDGLTDAHDASNNRLGEGRVLAQLERSVPSDTPDDILSRMFALVDHHAGGLPLRDDIAVVVVDRVPEAS
jgi:sigma-B regulation protein RsbU (phosphoserine phosphatase)